ncbi:sigma-70 family RNA polymerase sigma factor [Halalkalibacter akibai]|uniref:RNA polymerase sigma factor n=1 Tax=Halalkalibacter akibai (strain ATCC 43226 / DSM 21942 / CIP 109018 / JCM 9157 / 1139) TaxID=1236973 RepID=W4QSS4_HALA3|nr:sigma-70 family RNA polymerase sigma factor [Halalkalibacter akibai]GAE35151.1 RNA polymerase sigma factor RpoE [Halalkalibacter akibai JCM 9157]
MVSLVMKKWDSLENLYIEYYDEIFRYLLKRVQRIELAQDLTQDTFIKAFNGLSSFQGKSSIKTWLYTIAHNTFINWYRRDTKFHYHSIDIVQPMEQTLYSDPVASFQLKEKQQEVIHLIFKLKQDYQHVLILREFQELTYEEIAEVLDWKLSKVKTNLHRAKLELKKCIAKKEDDIDELFSN